jgi:hypothetical protein
LHAAFKLFYSGFPVGSGVFFSAFYGCLCFFFGFLYRFTGIFNVAVYIVSGYGFVAATTKSCSYTKSTNKQCMFTRR